MVVFVVYPADCVPDGDVVSFGGRYGGSEACGFGVACPAVLDRYLLIQWHFKSCEVVFVDVLYDEHSRHGSDCVVICWVYGIILVNVLVCVTVGRRWSVVWVSSLSSVQYLAASS